MECQTQIRSLNSRLVSRITQRKPTYLCSFLVLPRSSVQKFTLFSSYNSVDQTQPAHPLSAATVTQKPVTEPDLYAVKFKTFSSCKLGISRYPDFVYNAEGGTGTGTGGKTKSFAEDRDGEISINFDVKTLHIPPLTTATTKFLGLPLPPFLRIDIAPEVFQGIINTDTGKVDLEFQAKFMFSVGTVYRAPPLLVKTVLTSEESRGTIRRGRGENLDEEGRCRLVGVATVQPIDDIFMNTFLGLPTECIADLNAIISFSNS